MLLYSFKSMLCYAEYLGFGGVEVKVASVLSGEVDGVGVGG